MGVTINYRGRLADFAWIEDFKDRLVDFALEIGGQAQIWRSWADDSPERMVRSLTQEAIDGLAEGLRRYGLSRAAAEDPSILLRHVERVAEHVHRILRRPAEHPPVALDVDDFSGPADPEATEKPVPRAAQACPSRRCVWPRRPVLASIGNERGPV
jgi:hypothetical protein